MPSSSAIPGVPGKVQSGSPGLAGPRAAEAVLDPATGTTAPSPHDHARAGPRVVVSSGRGPDPAQGLPQRSSSAQTGPLQTATNGLRSASCALPEPGPPTRWDAFAHKPIHSGRFS